MKKILLIACLLFLTSVEANVSLNNLLENDKITYLQSLEQTPDAQLWDVFLNGQSELFFDSEYSLIARAGWWREAKYILEMGSGNGSYLRKLSELSRDKIFKGIEKVSQSVEQANKQNALSNVIFQEGDAEIFDDKLLNSADIVLFRLTLQHLSDPLIALKNAFHYLSENGYVVIIDSNDNAKRTSHPIPAIDEALRLVAEIQKKIGKGNRNVTLELLQELKTKQSPISEFYEVVISNLDIHGNLIYECEGVKGETKRLLYFRHILLFLTLLQRTYSIPVDLDKAYDELQEYFNDKNAWTSPGMHFLILKKKNNLGKII